MSGQLTIQSRLANGTIISINLAFPDNIQSSPNDFRAERTKCFGGYAEWTARGGTAGRADGQTEFEYLSRTIM